MKSIERKLVIFFPIILMPVAASSNLLFVTSLQ